MVFCWFPLKTSRKGNLPNRHTHTHTDTDTQTHSHAGTLLEPHTHTHTHTHTRSLTQLESSGTCVFHPMGIKLSCSPRRFFPLQDLASSGGRTARPTLYAMEGRAVPTTNDHSPYTFPLCIQWIILYGGSMGQPFLQFGLGMRQQRTRFGFNCPIAEDVQSKTLPPLLQTPVTFCGDLETGGRGEGEPSPFCPNRNRP